MKWGGILLVVWEGRVDMFAVSIRCRGLRELCDVACGGRTCELSVGTCKGRPLELFPVIWRGSL